MSIEYEVINWKNDLSCKREKNNKHIGGNEIWIKN